MKLKKIVTSMSLALLSGALLTGCAGDDGSDAPSAESIIAGITKLQDARKVLETNADIALAAYSDSVDTAIALKAAIADFKEDPTDAGLFTAAKTAWLVAREPYGQTEVYRFRNSPIDSTDYSSEDGPEGNINAWPLGEALIDYVTIGDDFGDDQVGVTEHQTGLNSGAAIIGGAITNANTIIGSNITIDSALMDNNMTAADEHDVISGYHAIEFMLWGQDLNSAAPIADTPRDATAGDRPIGDFTEATKGLRRLNYLEVVATKLVADLIQVRDGWKKGASYRTAFTGVTTQAEADKKLEEILTGMGTLSEGELAGERMQIALVNNSQEDEHSCFSDNTHRDIWLNAEGVSNSYTGTYSGYDANLDGLDAGDNVARKVEGYGLNQYIKTYGKESLATTLEGSLAQTELKYTAIDTAARAGVPFDVQIASPTEPEANDVIATIISLNKQASDIQAIATDLGLGDVVDDDASECTTSDPTAGC